MSRLLRILCSLSVLLVASLGGCILAAQGAADRPVLTLAYAEFAPYTSRGPGGLAQGDAVDLMDAIADRAGFRLEYGAARNPGELRKTWFGRDRSILEHPWFVNVAMIMAGLIWAAVALGIYAIRLRRQSVHLLAQNSENKLLVGALDKLRGAIVIFDHDMRAVHWNSGFGARFAPLVTVLSGEATLEELCCLAHGQRVMFADIETGGIAHFAQAAAQDLRMGRTVQHVVRSYDGATFDLSMFPIGPQYFAAIWVDVSEMSRQREQIEMQRSELLRKNAQLLAFSAMAAHDLKAPLAQQVSLVEFILEDLAEAEFVLPAEAQRHFSTLTDLSRRMTLLVRDLLEYAHTDAAQATPQRFAPDVRMADVLKLIALPPRMKVLVAPQMPTVRVDPTSFDLVMRNLVSNAVKHHDRTAGKITLRARQIGQTVIIEVEDDGPGICEAEHARIFEPFTRLTKVEGTGLGLAMVRKTVAGWGGYITLRRGAERGTVFTITLPAAMPGAARLSRPQSDAA